VGLIALDAKGFISVLLDNRVGETGSLILVLPQDGVSLAAADRRMTLVPTPPAGQHAQHDEAMQGARGVAVAVSSAGVKELAATALVPGSAWFVVARQPTSELQAPLDNQKRRMVSGTAGMLFVMVLILILGLRHVFKPLVSAADHADRMTRDEEPLAPLRVVRNDEVGHLTAAFNRLLDKLLETQAALRNMAHHDTLTGLPNRSLLTDVLMRALARARRNGTEVAVLFIDLDGFKPINDAHGHACGDEALQQVARRLTSAIRHADTVARIGGDEFVILLSDLAAGDRAGVQEVADKCLGTFAQPFHAQGHACRLGASVGIAMGHGDTPPDTLLSAADTAMYSAKQAGKGQVVWAAPEGVPAGT
jgi:diguanylate cyclase (GGDEF)-like protein